MIFNSNGKKKLLLVFQLNNLLLFLKDNRAQAVNPFQKPLNFEWHDSYKHYHINYREGKPDLLACLFNSLKKDVDVAVWSNLNAEMTQDLSTKYFTRYHRQLLFLMATNRKLYGDLPAHTSMRIRRDLNGVYKQFDNYSPLNTLVVTSEENLLVSHAANDLMVPKYSYDSESLTGDVGLGPLSKYICGLLLTAQKYPDNEDYRQIQLKPSYIRQYSRAKNRNATQTKYH